MKQEGRIFQNISPEKMRNLTIIAHIDAGKSTLADRLLELTQAVPKSKMREQFLDQLAQERRHGITIKLAPASLLWRPAELEGSTAKPSRMNFDRSGEVYLLNLIDTPGHADFAYEVSRALRAVEGAILLVDATKGVQAQTLSNFRAAQGARLKVLPVINKIDQATARLVQVRSQIKNLTGITHEPLQISAKTGQGVPELLAAIINQLPPPTASLEESSLQGPLRALIFDSYLDAYFGVKALVRVFAGQLRPGQKVSLANTKTDFLVKKVGIFSPFEQEIEALRPGMIGWVATGIKEPRLVPVGETLVEKGVATPAFAGFQLPEPKVFADFFPLEAKDFEAFAKALAKLGLNDPALSITLIQNEIFGRGFQVGALGKLHLQIAKERLDELAGFEIIATPPTVAYQILLKTGKKEVITNPAKLREKEFSLLEEPWIKLTVTVPADYLGPVLSLLDKVRYEDLQSRPLNHGAPHDLVVEAEVPLADTFLADFYDQLKSVSQGFASATYQELGYRPAELYLLEVLVAQEVVPGLSRILAYDQAVKQSRHWLEALKAVLPRQVFSVPLQMRLTPVQALPQGKGKIIAREDLPALKKKVTAGLYGGDFTRKKKLLQKQRAGQKRLQKFGRLRLSREVYQRFFQKL